MNRYDTIKVGFDSGAVQAVNENVFTWISGGTQKNESEYYNLVLKKDLKKPVGLNMLSIDRMGGRGKIELSAKRLESRYAESIHKNNIEYLVHKINETGIIKLDTNRFIDSSKMYRFDPCAILYDFDNTKKYINAINVVSSTNKAYFTRPYNKGGISYTAKAKTKKTQFRIYPKHPEMLKRKNKAIRQFVDPEVFVNALRPEMQVTNFKEGRDILGIEEIRDITLKDVLESEKPILYNGFSNVIKWDFGKSENNLWSHDSMKFVAETLTSDEKFAKKEKAIAEYFITRFFDNDVQKINSFLSNEIKGSISAYKRRYTEAIKRKPTENEIEQVSHFMDQLKRVA
jgi:hypothetical protein